MGRTLYWYLMRDLLRVFALAALVLAGIMSFGGLLRPLTRHGLDAIQVAQMWVYLMPAMMTYSLPVAAVFAASMVYGRLAADNELTACRGAGISYGSICGPAISLGIVSSLISLIFLSYVVPFFAYQAERVIYANVAKVVASEIQRKHSYYMGSGKPEIFAQEAYIPPNSGNDGEQIVVLRQPLIVDPERPDPVTGIQVPRSFAMARQATLYIRQGENNEVLVTGVLHGGRTFTRILGSGPLVGVEANTFGPITVESPLQQNVKFMDIARLKRLAARPEQAPRVKREMKKHIEDEQRSAMYLHMMNGIAENRAGYTIPSQNPFRVSMPAGGSFAMEGGVLVVLPPAGEKIQVVGGKPVFRYSAGEVRLKVQIDNSYHRAIINLGMRDVSMERPDEVVHKKSEQQVISIPLPAEIQALQSRRVSDYLPEGQPTPDRRRALMRQKMVSVNEVFAEMHARVSFGVSCLMLVMVGAVLGMQFRSGDFLSAFAVSVVPALLTIALVVAGSQAATQVSYETLEDPIMLGLALLWLGNVLAGILALVLFMRLRRT